MYVITAIMIFCATIIIKKRIQKRTYYFEQKTINLSQYTILLQNLPKLVT